MKIRLTILALLLSITTLIAQTPVCYFITNQDTYDDQELKAVVNGKVYTLVNKDERLCVRVQKTADFNNNGYVDVLVEILHGCGGTCCANSYQIFSYNGQEFLGTDQVGYDWNGAEITETHSGFNFTVETKNEGYGNTEMCSNKVETFRYKDYSLELIEIIKDKKLSAIAEIESASFKGKEDEVLILNYDLDGDGKPDKIICTYWPRWGRIRTFRIEFGNGKQFKGDYTPKRIGVLKSKTNNVHDLVLECDGVMKWDGYKYK